jgi:hypothetical protein
MDWGNDYFTFSDTNIEYIWGFLKLMWERDMLYKGHRSTEWCPRCGTSISQHELTQSGVYQERSDPSLFVRFPLVDTPGESLVVWTTTPWTLPETSRRRSTRMPSTSSENGKWVARASALGATAVKSARGESSARLTGRSTTSGRRRNGAPRHRLG